jgi:hypothetical protein
LVVLTSERIQLVCSTMCIPRVPQNPKIKSQPSCSLHTNSLERLQAWNYWICAAEEDQT